MKRAGPIIVMLLMLLLGAGLGYATGIGGVEISDTGPWQLSADYQGVYIQAAADAYAKDASNPAAVTKAIDRLQVLCQSDGSLDRAVQQALARYGDPVSRANLDQMLTLVKGGKITEASSYGVCSAKPTNVNPLAGWAWVGILLAAVGIVGYGVLTMIRAGDEEESKSSAPMFTIPTSSAGAAAAAAPTGERAKSTAPSGMPQPAPAAPASVSARSVAAAGAKISAQIERTDFATGGMEPPIVQFMTTYLHGDDLYDDSFSIETSAGEFLGECGMGISETLSAPGEAKKVTAFEVWLFDKNDIRTVTKVIMSDHSFNDDALRAKLAPKGEAVLGKSGDKVTLETASLRIQARVVDLAYGTGPVPPNSFFERITIELAAWKRDGSASGSAAGGSTPGGGLPNI